MNAVNINGMNGMNGVNAVNGINQGLNAIPNCQMKVAPNCNTMNKVVPTPFVPPAAVYRWDIASQAWVERYSNKYFEQSPAAHRMLVPLNDLYKFSFFSLQ